MTFTCVYHLKPKYHQTQIPVRFLAVCEFSAGIPSAAGSAAPPAGPRPPQAATLFPPVLKDEQPSSVVLRYMDGLTKKIQKITDLQLKLELK